MDSGQLGDLVPMVVITAMCAMVFGIVYLHRRERMAMIERGMDPRRYKPQSAPYTTLKWGLLLIGAGIGLCVAYTIQTQVFHDYENPAMYFGLIAVFGGLGLFISFLMEKKGEEVKRDTE